MFPFELGGTSSPRVKEAAGAICQPGQVMYTYGKQLPAVFRRIQALVLGAKGPRTKMLRPLEAPTALLLVTPCHFARFEEVQARGVSEGSPNHTKRPYISHGIPSSAVVFATRLYLSVVIIVTAAVTRGISIGIDIVSFWSSVPSLFGFGRATWETAILVSTRQCCSVTFFVDRNLLSLQR